MTRVTRKSAAKGKEPRFSEQERTLLPGSEKAAATGAVHVKATPAGSKVTVSVIVKRKEALKVNAGGGRRSGPVRVTRAEFKRRFAADPAALKLVKAFAREYGLKVEADPTAAIRRTVQLTCTAAQMQKAFGVSLEQKTIGGAEYRVRDGGIHLPKGLAGAVEAVLGLDNRPQAKAHFRVQGAKAANAADPTSYTPVQVAEAYQFPAGASGAGETIGIIELGGGYRQADLTAYFKTLNQPPPGITAVSVDGGKNSPSTASGADGEVMLDIEVAASVAPGANVAVYFSPNTDQGFIDAITTAVHDATNKPTVLTKGGKPATSAAAAAALT